MVSELWLILGGSLMITEQTDCTMKEAKVRDTEALVPGTKQNKISEENREMKKKKKDEEDEVYHTFNASQQSQGSREDNSWLIDSGCTNHMTPNEGMFVNLNTNINVPIRVGNGSVLLSKGKGDIALKGKRIIKDVLLVPKLGKNLLSVPQMITNGYQVLFKESHCINYDKKGRNIGKVQMVNKSFHIKWITQEETAMVVNNNDADLWHKRLGHTGYTNLKIMQAQKMVHGLPKFKVNHERCESCIIGKHSRDSFPKESETRAREKLMLIHSDLCGPMQHTSFSGSKYLLTFIDDATRMVWVYFLQSKSEVLRTFKNLVENQSNNKIKKTLDQALWLLDTTDLPLGFYKLCCQQVLLLHLAVFLVESMVLLWLCTGSC